MISENTPTPDAPDAWMKPWLDAWATDAVLILPEGMQFARKAAPPPEDPKLVDIFSRHQVWTDTLIGQFERSLKKMVDSATAETVKQLEAALSITDGAIDPTAANDKILANADAVFMDALNAEGYPELLASYTGKFGDQLPYLQEMLNALGESLGRTLPAVDFSPTDLKVLGRIEATTVSKLDRLFAGSAGIAMDRVMFSVAGLPFEQLVSTVADSMGKTLASARTWADTAVSTWYRTASSLQFDEIQKDTPGDKPLKFRYSGPEDLKTRPFCEALLVADKSYTREQIDAMNNDQLPNVFITCGGYNCRHLFILSKQ
jgi:hypothetical protein